MSRSPVLVAEPFREPLSVRLAAPEPGLAIYWLGQAGFVLAWGEQRWLVDPYLSDALARKYAGQEFSHERMMPAPIGAGEFSRVDLVLCTHRHGDHLDPGTLTQLAARHPGCRFVVPAAEWDHARAVGLPAARLIGAEAFRPLLLGDPAPEDDADDWDVLPLPAAHEALERDATGRHRFLGYVLRLGRCRVYHSGDSVPYEGLTERLRECRCDVALLPVNGRREFLRRRGIAGNFTLTEATELCRGAGIPAMVAHHHGMFAFNTVEPSVIDEAARASEPGLRLFRARLDHRYLLG